MLRLSEIFNFNENWAFNNKPVRLKCVKCLADCTNPGQVKIYKTIKGILRHFSNDHKGEFWVDDCKQLLKMIAVALDSGVIVSE